MEKQIEEINEIIASKICESYSPICDEWQPHDCGKCYANDTHISEISETIYNEGYRKQEWISVEERLPECENVAETEALLFITRAGMVEAGYFGRGSVWRDVYFRHYRNSVGWDVSDVTHWMPMPEPPKGE